MRASYSSSGSTSLRWMFSTSEIMRASSSGIDLTTAGTLSIPSRFAASNLLDPDDQLVAAIDGPHKQGLEYALLANRLHELSDLSGAPSHVHSADEHLRRLELQEDRPPFRVAVSAVWKGLSAQCLIGRPTFVGLKVILTQVEGAAMCGEFSSTERHPVSTCFLVKFS